MSTFPTWPPPSGGYPNVTPEMGPVLNPYPYGTPQQANISTANPYPPGGIWKGTFYPDEVDPTSGQNQGPGYGLPQSTKPWEVGPIKAPPSISAISPPPIMGPGPQGVAPWEAGPLAGNPFPAQRWPQGSYMDGMGTVITPTYVINVGK